MCGYTLSGKWFVYLINSSRAAPAVSLLICWMCVKFLIGGKLIHQVLNFLVGSSAGLCWKDIPLSFFFTVHVMGVFPFVEHLIVHTMGKSGRTLTFVEGNCGPVMFKKVFEFRHRFVHRTPLGFTIVERSGCSAHGYKIKCRQTSLPTEHYFTTPVFPPIVRQDLIRSTDIWFGVS